MAEGFRKGDKVEWDHSQGTTHGHVVRRLTERTTVGGQVIAATPDEPRYLVESEKTGKRAAHRPEELRRR